MNSGKLALPVSEGVDVECDQSYSTVNGSFFPRGKMDGA